MNKYQVFQKYMKNSTEHINQLRTQFYLCLLCGVCVYLCLLVFRMMLNIPHFDAGGGRATFLQY